MACNHEFRLLEKNNETGSYTFYCVKCLEIREREVESNFSRHSGHDSSGNFQTDDE